MAVNQSKNRANIRLLQRIMIAVCILSMAMGIAGCKPAEDPDIAIETPYVVLKFPKEAAELVRYQQESEAEVVSQVFSMEVKGSMREVFRIWFNNYDAGTRMGYLTTEQGSIPVSYDVTPYTETEFPDEESWTRYYTVMDGFSTLLESISQSKAFRETDLQDDGETRTHTLKYWELTLPAAVRCEEITGETGYRVEFYGKIAGKEIKMYAIHLGEPAAQSELGFYLADGEKLRLTVESADLDSNLELSQQDHLLMESINSVIPVIMADPNFTTE